jgi:hypothetical protein
VSRAPRKSNPWSSRAAPFSPLLLFSVTTAVAVWFLVVIGEVWPFIGSELGFRIVATWNEQRFVAQASLSSCCGEANKTGRYLSAWVSGGNSSEPPLY